MRSHRAGLTLGLALVVGMLTAGCGLGGSSTPPTTTAVPLPTTTHAAPVPTAPTPNPRLVGFTPCAVQPFDEPWLCRTIDVPIDRAHPAAGTIHLAVYALAHTDTSTPPSPPVFTTPGGPGYLAWANYGMWTLTQNNWVSAHHDVITVDPRGTGKSGAINCPGLQAQPAIVLASVSAAQAACARHLGTSADRYGAGDRALDLEQVRQTLGYDLIDYYSGSAGALDIQAYAHRFPGRLHALVIDAGYLPGAKVDGAFDLGQGVPRALIDMAVLACRRDTGCHGRDPAPAKTLRGLILRVQRHQIKGVDEVAIVGFLLGGDLLAIVAAADDARDGDLTSLRALVAPTPPDAPEAFDNYSAGDNSAASCNDSDAPWLRSDPLPVRRRKLAAALAALPADSYAPFTREAWAPQGFDWCLAWPAPRRFVPVMPTGSPLIGVPALLLSGDLDRNQLTINSRGQMQLFSNARFLVVAGAGHPTMTGDTGTCVAGIVTRFLDTLDPGDTSCAATPPV